MRRQSELILDDRRLSWDEIEEMNYEQLTELLTIVTEAAEDIGDQIRHAKGDYANHGKSADWAWMKRADGKRRVLGRARTRIAELRRSQRPSYVLAVKFQEIAREVLQPETYLLIEQQAKESGRIPAPVG